jgi:hypothetical protein
MMYFFSIGDLLMDELECMRVIDESLQSVAEEPARVRIATWVAAKYQGIAPASSSQGGVERRSVAVTNPTGTQIAGIAKLSQAGELQLTVRDFKAKSASDAAVRLAHVAIWAAGKLTGELSVSSKKVIVPLLKKYRCYDGNTRGALAKDKGLVRDGDQLSLDFHAEQFAEKVVAEILDSTVEGKWTPGVTRRRSYRVNREFPSEGA